MQVDQGLYSRAFSVSRSDSSQNRSRNLSVELNNVISTVDAIFIKQKFETLEVITQFETENAYFIYKADPESQESQNLILTAYEKSNMFVRNMLPENSRSFSMELKDTTTGASLVNIQRPFKCTCLCWARPVMMVYDYVNNEDLIGTITTPLSCCQDYRFIIKDQEDNVLFTIVGDCCQCAIWCNNLPCNRCQTSTFIIRDYEGVDVGFLQKKSSGFFKSLVSDCDNYFIKFPYGAPPSHKYLLIVGAIFIDYWLFEGKKSLNQRQ